jgi:acetyl esterase/lipase
MSRTFFGALAAVLMMLAAGAQQSRAQTPSKVPPASKPGPEPGVIEPLSERAVWAARLASMYRVTPGITYFTADNYDARLDLYQPVGATKPTPTLIFFHGGGWAGLDRTRIFLHTLPYLEMGWAVVNLDFRVTRVARAPGAVEDGRCALRWVLSNAAAYNLDSNRIVVSGISSGGHLALTTGMLSAAAGFDQQCPPCMQWSCRADEEMKVAAIVNWFGITDVTDLLQGPNTRVYALAWAGGTPDRAELARRVSPVTLVRPGLPPIITVHGTIDPSVPYAHATRLHEALTRAGVPNKLHTIEQGNHGGFTMADTLGAHSAIRAFLAEHRVLAADSGSPSRGR